MRTTSETEPGVAAPGPVQAPIGANVQPTSEASLTEILRLPEHIRRAWTDGNWDASATPQPAEQPDPATRGAMERPAIVCLCGSTRFYQEFQRANYEETMAGKIVLSVGFYAHSSEAAHGETWGCTPEQKKALDELHFRKIEMSDEVLILNVRGYIGESTGRELAHARSLGKTVRFLEPDALDKEALPFSGQCKEGDDPIAKIQDSQIEAEHWRFSARPALVRQSASPEPGENRGNPSDTAILDWLYRRAHTITSDPDTSLPLMLPSREAMGELVSKYLPIRSHREALLERRWEWLERASKTWDDTGQWVRIHFPVPTLLHNTVGDAVDATLAALDKETDEPICECNQVDIGVGNLREPNVRCPQHGASDSEPAVDLLDPEADHG